MAYVRFFYGMLKQDLRLYSRAKGRLCSGVLFFIVIGTLFPVSGIGPTELNRMGPNIIWISVLCAALLAIEGVFQQEMEAGRIEAFMVSPWPLPLFMLSKCISHWVLTVLPLVCLAPLMGLLFNMPGAGFWALSITLLLGTLILHGIGALVSTLLLGIHQGSLLLMLCVLPLIVPVLMIGVSAVQQASVGLPWSGHLALLAVLWIGVILGVPWSMAYVLKISAE